VISIFLIERCAVGAFSVFNVLQQKDDLRRLFVKLLQIVEQLIIQRDCLEARHQDAQPLDSLGLEGRLLLGGGTDALHHRTLEAGFPNEGTHE